MSVCWYFYSNSGFDALNWNNFLIFLGADSKKYSINSLTSKKTFGIVPLFHLDDFSKISFQSNFGIVLLGNIQNFEWKVFNFTIKFFNFEWKIFIFKI